MAIKIATFLITLAINVVAGVAIFFFLLVAMNGFSESDATYGLVTYIVLAVIVSLFMSAGATFVAHLLLKRGLGGVLAPVIAVPVFSVIGIGVKFVCSIIAIGVADFVRVNY